MGQAKEAIDEIWKEFGKDRFKIVVITATAFDSDRARFKKKGVQEFISKPFRMEQIINCLDKVLNVKFEYEEQVEKEETPEALDYSKISLPEELISKFKEAADLYNISSLEEALDTLRNMDGNNDQLAIEIHDLLKNYEIVKIGEIIDKLKRGEK